MRRFVLLSLLLCSFGAQANDVLQDVIRVLSERHVDPPPEAELARLDEAGLADYLKAHDPYSAYWSAEQYQRFLKRNKGGVGIGIQLFEADGGFIAVPYPGGPAYTAGMVNRSRLMRIENRPVFGMALDEVAALLRGAEGSSLQLEVLDQVTGQAKFLRITRAQFIAPSVSYVNEDDIPLLRVWDFRSRETMRGLRRGVERLKRENQPVVIDLRNSQGGDLFEALDAVSLFVDAGLSIAVIKNGRSKGREFKSLTGRRISQQPAILLVGSGTASAAEAFAKALRWYQSGLLVGENTHGKCYTQTIKPLSNGGALKFSNGKMLGPEGSDCSDEGLRPDVPVANSEQKSVRELLHESAKWVRAQSNRRAILDGHEAPGR